MLFLTILFSITPAKAAFSSFVLPGSGDYLSGDKNRGLCFMAAEAAIWLTYFDSKAGEDKKDEISRNFAAFYASCNLSNEDDDYFNAMEDFLTNIDYNEMIAEQARRLYPDTLDAEVMQDRIEARRQYIEANSYTGSDAWNWSSKELKDNYRDIRRDKRKLSQRATNMVGLALANRVVSLFTTYFFGKRVSLEIKDNEVEMGFHF
jgi:hypothetical protein